MKKKVKKIKRLKKPQKKRRKLLRKRKNIFKKAVKKTAKKVLKKKRRMVQIAPAQEFSTQQFFKAKIRVIGIGGGGGSIVSEIGRSLGKASFVVADTDVRAFKKKGGVRQFLFGEALTHGLGTGLNIDLAKAAAESEKEKITKLFEGQDIIIFIACLGGGLGSGATQVFAELAKNFDGISFGIFTLPFKFEGKNKYAIATRALRQLRTSLNVSITIPNERIFKVIEANTAITDAFSMVNKNLIESLESLIDLIYSPGVINIDFADLKAILAGSGNLAFLNTVEASGKDKAGKIVESVLNNPLYQNNNFIVQKVLFNIASSGNLSMFEVDKISRAIALHHEGAKIIFGISKEASLKNKIKTTLLMTGPAAGAAAPAAHKSAEINTERRRITKKKVKIKQVVKIPKKPKKVKKAAFKKPGKKSLAIGQPVSVFAPAPMLEGAARLSIIEDSEKKAIRRNALEIKEVEAKEEQAKTQQEKEWEIPAFLRKIKIK